MAILSICAAAKAAGVSRQSMYNLINDGKISVTTDNVGKKGIDLSEILRVFGEIKPITQGAALDDEKTMMPDQSSALIDALRDQITNLKDQLQKAEDREKEAKARAVAAEARADDYLVRLLPAPALCPEKKSFFTRLFGGGK